MSYQSFPPPSYSGGLPYERGHTPIDKLEDSSGETAMRRQSQRGRRRLPRLMDLGQHGAEDQSQSKARPSIYATTSPPFMQRDRPSIYVMTSTQQRKFEARQRMLQHMAQDHGVMPNAQGFNHQQLAQIKMGIAETPSFPKSLLQGPSLRPPPVSDLDAHKSLLFGIA